MELSSKPLRKGKRLMVNIQEKHVPEEFHRVDPSQVEMHQHNDTDWHMEVKEVSVTDRITIKGKVGGIHMLLQELVEFSCEGNVQLRIVNGTYTLLGHINVFRGNMLDIIEHLLHEIDLLAHAIAHAFDHQLEVTFTCEQTIEFNMAT